MAAGGSPYVVEWQLGDEEGQRASPRWWPSSSIVLHSQENLERLADLSGVLADADAAAVVACGPTGIAVEAASLTAPRLLPGATIPVHPSLGDVSTGAIGLPLSGRRRWCRSSPPPGFGVARVGQAPSLVVSGQLLLLANRERSLSEVNLRLVASYLASVRQGPMAGNPYSAAGQGRSSSGDKRGLTAPLVLHS